jgi:NCS1 family nucleobase:cation symporter-1
VALVVGVIPCVPGFLNAAFPQAFPEVAPFLKNLYAYAWFVGFALAGVVYLALMRGRARA